MRVLIVEDEKRMAQLLKKGLEREKHSVALAHTGPDGFASAQSYFDVVVLDIMLPGFDGLSIAKWIANAHHARIEVEIQLEKGSTFRVFIPLDHSSFAQKKIQRMEVL